MRIGTTPTHTFTLPAQLAGQIRKVRVLYAQVGNIVVKKECENPEGHIVEFKLTQEETLRFSHTAPVSIQIRVLTINGDSLTSDVTVVSPYVCLENEVFA